MLSWSQTGRGPFLLGDTTHTLALHALCIGLFDVAFPQNTLQQRDVLLGFLQYVGIVVGP